MARKTLRRRPSAQRRAYSRWPAVFAVDTAKCKRHLPRFLLFDNDSIFSDQVTETIKNIGNTPQRSAFRSPWQNGIAERWVGSARRELLDHVIVLSERLRQYFLPEYADYYNADRVHTELQDSPNDRPTEHRPTPRAQVVSLPGVGGLHHRYEWQDAA